MSHSTDALPDDGASSEVLDDGVFQELIESLDSPATVATIYSKFLGNAATFICELATQEAAARVETLHTLKGSAAMLGANRMAALAAQLQKHLHGSPVQVEQAMRDLETELEQFRAVAAARLLAAGGTLDP